MYRFFIKPILDFILALIGLILLSPVFFALAILIKFDSNGPVFFRQERLGKGGRTFRIFKFRSMVDHAIEKGTGLETFNGDPRITKIGSFLRKTSLDEIPQLINILLGDMSFIGPRPPVINFPYKIEDYNEFDRRRFLVKPGISGLAAIRCREIHDWSINIPIDVEYVSKQSFILDAKLFIKSLLVFVKTDNIYSNDKPQRKC
ncbi:sugar transferase [Paludibacter propionicigenes WB4]|uniref:Sugar transferase n=1 Tax=Paludibacter propionicigenes (strain DSM 17365 / JCM 13257 / WB4) TaxID=694427 RepID=E4T311_PALPW|nr:sugar transferase [Paludibacter propionicigenes]ADQ79105.1 sugar transferase [Paludibacter propionicigenes WB4]